MNPLFRALKLAALATTAAQAALLHLHYSGDLSSDTTLGGAPLGVDTPFSITATFYDGSPSLASGIIERTFDDGSTQEFPDFYLFPVTALSLTLAGSTYTAIPDANLNVALTGGAGRQGPFMGLGNGDMSRFTISRFYFGSILNSAFDPSQPNAMDYHDGSPESPYVRGPYNISLVGVSGGLSIAEVADWGRVSITADAVPEPAEYAVVTGLALGVFARLQRRKQVRNG